MKKIQLFLFMVTSIILCQGQDRSKAYQLTVQVENIKENSGNLMFAIYDNKEMFLKKEVDRKKLSVQSGNSVITFSGLKNGTYAVSIYHDINGNGELDSNFIGIPTKPYGFSNDAKGRFGPPDFEDCVFELKNEFQRIVITL